MPARLIEPSSKLDAIRVIDETGLPTPAYRTITRALPRYATDESRAALAAACAARAAPGPVASVLYDASTLCFETHEGDGFRQPGYSKERRLEPRITIGLLTDTTGFPSQLRAFEGNKAETKTMLPVIDQSLHDHPVQDVTVVADTGMPSHENRTKIVDAGLPYIIGQIVRMISEDESRNTTAAPERTCPSLSSWSARTAPRPVGIRSVSRARSMRCCAPRATRTPDGPKCGATRPAGNGS